MPTSRHMGTARESSSRSRDRRDGGRELGGGCGYQSPGRRPGDPATGLNFLWPCPYVWMPAPCLLRAMTGSVAYVKDPPMTRLTVPAHPLLLGFEELERLIDRTGKSSGDGYPPYNIERLPKDEGRPELLRITLAVAGFTREQLDIQLEDKQLTVRGKQSDDDAPRDYIHRGIAARQFCRTFVLADGLEVRSAGLNNGLLSIDLIRLEPARFVRTIAIGGNKSNA